MNVISLLLLLSSLVEVHLQQDFPYVSFMGQTLANHSYVNLSLVGEHNSVQCHTDLGTCCSSEQGPHRGDWYFPTGTRLPFPGDGDVYESRRAQRVELRRINIANSLTGIYCCIISTSVRDTPVYVGLYTASGGKQRES